MSNIFKELKESPEYKMVLAKMSDEERQATEKATEELLRHFEDNVLGPLKSVLGK